MNNTEKLMINEHLKSIHHLLFELLHKENNPEYLKLMIDINILKNNINSI